MTDQELQTQRSISPRAYRGLVASLGMSVAGAGRYLGVSQRTGRRFVEGVTDVPASCVLLLRLLDAHNIRPVVPPAPKKKPK